jgi:hypothetical protein
MQATGIDEVSGCWRVKCREVRRDGHCACFLIFSQIHLFFLVQ